MSILYEAPSAELDEAIDLDGCPAHSVYSYDHITDEGGTAEDVLDAIHASGETPADYRDMEALKVWLNAHKGSDTAAQYKTGYYFAFGEVTSYFGRKYSKAIYWNGLRFTSCRCQLSYAWGSNDHALIV